MNLTQLQRDAKEAYLNRQQEQMLALYKQSDTSERNAVIKQIDSFLSVISQDEKAFWLTFKRKLERLNESAFLFPLGNIYLTIGAREAMQKANQEPFDFLTRHQTGDYGLVCEEDKLENDFSVKEGFRILSSYHTSKGERLWCITEANRSSTTISLPSEY
jgi:hypothetical protein